MQVSAGDPPPTLAGVSGLANELLYGTDPQTRNRLDINTTERSVPISCSLAAPSGSAGPRKPTKLHSSLHQTIPCIVSPRSQQIDDQDEVALMARDPALLLAGSRSSRSIPMAR
ncbi:unnamed protein product [Boreogadus saida]